MYDKTSRRKFLNQLGKGFLIGGALSFNIKKSVQEGEKKPNILFIIVDDLRPELGCYGADHIKSPNIDNLAAEGITFNKAYIQQAVCAASRASILTGCRPDTTGVNFPYSKWFKEVFLKNHPDIQTFYFRNGYNVTTYGKVHHGYHGGSECSKPHFRSKKPKWPGEKNHHNNPKRIVDFINLPDTDFQDGDLTNQAINHLQTIAGNKKPFFLGIGFYKPHLPFVSPQRFARLYNAKKIKLSPVPQSPEGTPVFSHPWQQQKNEKGEWILRGDYPLMKNIFLKNSGKSTMEFHQMLRHGYFSCVSFIDAQVGKIINELKKLELWENTVIVLLGDQGIHLGDHSWWAKGNCCEFDTRIPLIVRIPGQKQKGIRTDSLIEAVDIFPTLLDISQIPIPKYVEGSSFFPVISDPRKQWKRGAFSQYPRGHRGTQNFKEGFTVRTKNHRYTEWQNNSGRAIACEFYDYTKDPIESKNLINDPAYSKQIKIHEKILKDGWKKALPPGIVNISNNPKGNDDAYLKIDRKNRTRRNIHQKKEKE